MRFSEAMYEFVISLLKAKIPQEYHYHNCSHTEYIFQRVIEIAVHESCSPAEQALLKAAALWHDVGYINIYEGHEEEGCRLVRKYFPEFAINESDTEAVCGMIMATRFPQKPCTKLEEIVADADLSYLGTNEAPAIANQLYLELKHRNPLLTKKDWNDLQISFIKSHRYFTNYCIQRFEPLKQAYLSQLIKQRDAA